ncbi:hypothetical protein J2Y03_002391 [Neobacillus niacini]|uniref:hypothetical protein n=1 Tax=Neobacillus niacini TaxID=86668 RepID=UPI002855ADF7|nr:hypothetical protein [Neobacillus niacini]MDR7077367.1 hypothetical protein [Neobacillus niacini]
MNVTIHVYYKTNDNNVLRRGNFPLKGRKSEMVALEFWKWIKRNHPFECEIEKIIVDGEDITEKVKKINGTNI